LSAITTKAIRSWHAALSKEHPSTGAKAYRLLATILRTAVEDRYLLVSPCRLKGAGQEKASERPVASVAEVQALADAMPERLRLAVLLAAWCQLRRGELLGLRRRDVDLQRGTVSVRLTRTTTGSGTIEKAPKTDAGKRTLAVPPNVLAVLEHHLNSYVGAEPDSPLLVGEKGGAVIPGVLHAAWHKARTTVQRPDLRLHDLRHAGLTWSAAAGATIAELMHWAGHASPAAALRYQHATIDRDRALADALAGSAPRT